jgi:hypothetical protein
MTASNIEEEDEEDDNESIEMARKYRLKRLNSVGGWDDDALKEKAEVDEHLANFVTGQMERIRTGDSSLAHDMEDEVESTANGNDDYFQVRR